MCKLFAYVCHHKTKLTPHIGNKINRVLKHLFYINSYGQKDGSGIMWTTSEGDTHFHKEEEDSTELILSTTFEKLYPDMYKHKFVAGHTRYSTVGVNSSENSHPFHHGRYIGMQNGTISNDHKNLVVDSLSPCEVDSESVIWSFDKQGIEATFENYEGEGVFMFIDLVDTTFNIVKNHKRTLHQAKLTGYEIYIFATDAHALEYACSRAGLSIDDVKVVSSGKLVTYSLDNKTTTKDLTVKLPSFTCDRPYNNYKANNYLAGVSNDYYYNSWGRGYWNPPPTPPSVITNKVTPIVNTTSEESGEYLGDCVMCSNPLFAYSLVFADNVDITKAECFSCSCCVTQVTESCSIPMHQVPTEGSVCETH